MANLAGRRGLLVLCTAWVLLWVCGTPSHAPAQDRKSMESFVEEPAAKKNAAPRQRTWLDTIQAGGTCGAVIILLSVVAVGFERVVWVEV